MYIKLNRNILAPAIYNNKTIYAGTILEVTGSDGEYYICVDECGFDMLVLKEYCNIIDETDSQKIQ